MTALRLLPPLLLLLLAGCVAAPDYAGGPTSEEPYGVIDPGTDITLWQVDEHDVQTRSGPIRVAPGRRMVKLRIEADIADETPTPWEYRTVPLAIEEDMLYTIDRRPGEYPPWELDIRQRSLR